MKKIFMALALAFSAAMAWAGSCAQPIMVKVNNQSSGLSDANITILTSRLEQLVASQGIGSATELSHLCLKAEVAESSKEIVRGTRPSVAITLDVYLTLENVISGEKFGAASVNLNGAGSNDNQAYQHAFAQINTGNAQLGRFLERSQDRMLTYYRSHMPAIIQQSRVLANRGDYEKALYLLATVPQCLPDYEEVGNAMYDIYQESINRDCNEKLQAATAVWRSGLNDEAALRAAAILADIDRRSSCAPDADALLDEISARVDENIRQRIAREEEDRALERSKVEADIELRRAEIEAIRDISLANARNVLGQDAAGNADGQQAPADDNSANPDENEE